MRQDPVAAHGGQRAARVGLAPGPILLALICAATLAMAFPPLVLAQSAAPAVEVKAAPAEAPAPETPAAETAASPAAETGDADNGVETSQDSPATPESTTADGAVSTPSPADEEAPAESSAGSADSDSVLPFATAAGGPLVVVSWGGVYSQSQEEAVLRPFSRSSGIQIDSKVYAGDLDQLRAQVAAGETTWDVIDLDPAELEAGCREGLLEKLSLVLPAAPDGTGAREDFLPGTLHPCGIGSLAWSMLIAHNLGNESDREGDAQPGSVQDFFDLATFPGRRGLRRSPMANLEWALLADGVEPARIYDLLRSEAGVARAFAKLDTIKDSVIWWEDADKPAELLKTGQVVMTSTYNAPAFNDIAIRQQPFELIWDGQIWDIDLWAVPATAPHRDAALAFLHYATGTERLARQTRWIPYGPVRRSSIALVANYVHSDVDIAPFLPTSPENLETALRNDAQFWREEGPELVERFNAWLAR